MGRTRVPRPPLRWMYARQPRDQAAAAGLRPASTPPPMGSVAPVMQAALLLARKRTASTTSCGCPCRPSGWEVLAWGLLTRERSGKDRRGAYAVLTEKGHAALRQAWPVYARGIASHFAQHLDAVEARTLTEALQRVLDAARRAAHRPGTEGER